MLNTHSATNLLRRRAWLQRLGLTALASLGTSATLPAIAANPGRGMTHFAACWMDVQGRHHAGWLQLNRHGKVNVLRGIELPTRGHGLALLPDGSLLVAARRPGDWLLRLAPTQPPQWVWQEPGRVFSGHVAVAADGQTVLTTEIDTDSGQGVLGVRDVGTLEKRAEFKTKGLDPHAVLALPAIYSASEQAVGHEAHPLTGMLFVANGGIDTAAETGRIKRHLDRMESSIVCLHPATGELLGQWRLPDRRLSLRHLAWAWPDAAGHPPAPARWPVLGIALQAEHDDAAQKAAAPLLATLDWTKQPGGLLQAAQGQPDLAGYGGDIVATVGGRFLVSATRAGKLATYHCGGTFLASQWLPAAGALAGLDGTVWAAGQANLTQVSKDQASAPIHLAWAGARLDNHWLMLRQAGVLANVR